MKSKFSIIVAALLLLSVVGIVPSNAQSAAEPLGDALVVGKLPPPDIDLSKLTADLGRVRPLNTSSLYIAEPPVYKSFEKLKPPVMDKSVRFDARQLIAPGVLVAVSTFGLWDKKAIEVNHLVRDNVNAWRGDRFCHVDDWVQYLPVVAYAGLGLAGAKSRHTFGERVIVLATSYIAMGIMVNAVKYTVREQRPDSGARNSYPSGHTATAFMGAELVRSEYGLGYGIAAYTVACGIAAMRVYNSRHWLNDVMAGAGIGILSARIGYWMLPLNRRLFGIGRTKKGFGIATAPFYDYSTSALGGSVAIRFR